MIALAALGGLVAPANAVDHDQMADFRPGIFGGFRLKMSLGGNEGAKPRAGLSLAPTGLQISSHGISRTLIGEGIGLNFTPSSKPTLTIAGARVSTAFGPQSLGNADEERKMGVSTGGWVAIGMGTVALLGGAYFLYLVHEDKQNDEDDPS